MVYPFFNKAPKMLNITKAKLFRGPNILIMSIHCTKISPYSFFRHPVWQNSLLLAMYIHFEIKAPKMLYIKIKIFKRPNISIISKYLNFCTKISPFSFFAHIVWLKSAVMSLYYPFKKKLLKCSTSQGQNFSGDPIL